MFKRLFVILLSLCLIAGCSPIQPPVPTSTPQAMIPQVTDISPTDTPTPTSTPAPTETPAPTATPVPQAVSVGNAAQIALARRFGNGAVVQAAWSPDGKQLAVLTTVYLKAFDPSTGDLQWEVETGTVQQQVVYSADGQSIFTRSAGAGVQVYDPVSGSLVKTALDPQEGVAASSLSPHGEWLIRAGMDEESTVWDVAANKKLASNNGASMSEGIEQVLVSPDGATFWTDGIDSTGNQQVMAWSMKDGAFRFALQGIGYDYIKQFAITPDGAYITGISRLKLTANVDYTLITWDAANGKLLKKITLKEDLDEFAFLPGKSVALYSGAQGMLQSSDLVSGESGSLYGVLGAMPVTSLAVSEDGKWAAAALSDGKVKIIDLEAKKSAQEIKLDVSVVVPLYRLGGTNYITRYDLRSALAVSPDYIAVPSNNFKSIVLHDPYTFKQLRSLGSAVDRYSVFANSADGKLLAAVDQNIVTVWDTGTGSQVKQIKTDHQYVITKVLLSPDGKLVATLSRGRLGELYLWDVATGKKVHPLSGLYTMAFSPDGKTMVSDNVDFGVYVWDVQTGKKLASPSADYIFDLAFSPDGKTVAISGFDVHKKIKGQDNLITFLDVAAAKTLPLTLKGHPGSITAVRYSPDGSRVASADDQGNLRLWDAKTGDMLKQIPEAAVRPNFIEFLGPNALVLSSVDGVIKVYEVH